MRTPHLHKLVCTAHLHKLAHLHNNSGKKIYFLKQYKL